MITFQHLLRLLGFSFLRLARVVPTGLCQELDEAIQSAGNFQELSRYRRYRWLLPGSPQELPDKGRPRPRSPAV